MKRWMIAVALLGCTRAQAPRETPFTLTAGSLAVHAPARASGMLHVESAPGAYVDVEALGVNDVAGSVDAAGRVVYEGAFARTRLVHLASPGRTEELRYTDALPETLAYRVHLGPALRKLRVVESSYVEALDDRDVARLRTEPAFVVDARGVRRELVPRVELQADAWSLTFAIDGRGLVAPFVIDPAWTLTTAMAHTRRNAPLIRLASGKVLVLGGISTGTTYLKSAEAWDPATGSWTAAGAMQKGRAYHGAALLSSGKILVVAGTGIGDADVGHSAEVFDPAAGTSTLLALGPADYDGYVRVVPLAAPTALVVGSTQSALLDYAAEKWTPTPYVTPRALTNTALLPTGKVLVFGGSTSPGGGSPIKTVESFDPATKAWKSVGSMLTARTNPEVQPLPSGKLLVAGGQGLTTAEIYDPVTNTSTAAGTMSAVHSFCGSAVLGDKRVLVFGGDTLDGVTDATDIYDPATGTWSFAGKLSSPRDEFGFAALDGNKVMIAGGTYGEPVAISEIFEPLGGGKKCLGPGECASNFCVDGFCCEKGACASGETCGGSGNPGFCRKIDGSTCAGDAECGSGHCVDGVCCDSACAGPCGACNLTGNIGKCIAVPAGDAPHGTRAACPGDGDCKGRCGGIQLDKCTQFPGSAISCAPAFCKDGVESLPRGCDGAGACAAATTRACDPYVCGTDACKTQCDADTDCANGNTCDLVTRKCVIAAKCDDDHTVTSADGKTKDCTPYKCSGSKCLEACSDSTSCAGGFVCDTAASRCVPGAASVDDGSSGCAMSAGSHGFGGLLSLALLGLARRRKLGGRSRVS